MPAVTYEISTGGCSPHTTHDKRSSTSTTSPNCCRHHPQHRPFSHNSHQQQNLRLRSYNHGHSRQHQRLRLQPPVSNPSRNCLRLRLELQLSHHRLLVYLRLRQSSHPQQPPWLTRCLQSPRLSLQQVRLLVLRVLLLVLLHLRLLLLPHHLLLQQHWSRWAT